MPEEELDDLFRTAASEFHPEFDPAAWEAMEKELDASPPPPPGFWPRIGWLTALLLTMGLGFWLSLGSLEDKAEDQALSSTVAVGPAAPAAPNRRDRKSAGPARLGTAPARPATGQAAPGGQPHKPQHRYQSPAGLPARHPAEKTLFTQQGRTRSGGRHARPLVAVGRQSRPQENRRQLAGLPAAGNKSPAGQESSRPEAAGQTAPDHQAGAVAATARPVQADSARSRQAAAQPAADSLAQPTAVLADSAAGNKRPAGWSRLEVRLLVAPDLSTVGFARPEGISTNAGIVLSYQLTPRWSLATGVLHAHKVYGARPEDYGKPGYWDNRQKPLNIEATCRVLDIPLNVGYRLLSREKSAITLSTGLSSYWMLSEDYDYYYRYASGNGYSKSWGVRHENRHLFSIYNLSGLYTHRLGPAMTWGVEPFVKVPLAGVGAGKVKLASTGVFFSLGYRFR